VPDAATCEITVELFGVPRLRDGRAEILLSFAGGQGPLAELLERLRHASPALAQSCFDGPRLRPQYVLNLDGQQFLTDPQAALRDGDRLLLFSADAGG